MENYIEIAVSRKNSFKDTIACFVSSVVPLLIGTYLVILLYASSSTSLLFLGIIACAVLYYVAYKIFCSFNVEWEYTLVGTELRFSKIINKNKRRELLTVPLAKVECVVPATEAKTNHQFKTAQAMKYNFTSQTETKTYSMLCMTDKGKRVIIEFEPDSRMIDNFNTTLRGKFSE